MFEDELGMKIAQLETWHFLETDPVTKERVAAELARYIRDAENAKAEKEAGTEKSAQIEKKREQEPDAEKAESQTNEIAAGEHAEQEKGIFERIESGRSQSQPGEHYERMLEIPEYIRNSPMYKQGLIEHKAAQAERSVKVIANQGSMEVPATDPYEQAAKALDAATMKAGQEIEGEVVDVAQVNGMNYYVIEQDGERLAVPAGEKPEYDKGEEITVSLNKEGFDIGEVHGYGR